MRGEDKHKREKKSQQKKDREWVSVCRFARRRRRNKHAKHQQNWKEQWLYAIAETALRPSAPSDGPLHDATTNSLVQLYSALRSFQLRTHYLRIPSAAYSAKTRHHFLCFLVWYYY